LSNHHRPRFWHRAIKYIASKRLSSWVLARVLYRLDNIMMRTTRGRRNLTTLLTGLPVITLVTTGASSGQPRTSPLVGISMGEEIMLVGSNFGGANNPGWYYNLVAHPEAFIIMDGSRKGCTARQAHGEEWERCWQTAVDVYAGYQAYRRRASHRHIPIMLLKPNED